MNTIKTTGFAALVAIAFAALSATVSTEASAASSCPGGGTQKCTVKCTGPVLAPKCEYVEPCTCTLGTTSTGTKAALASRLTTAVRGPLINRPPLPPIAPIRQNFSARIR